MISLKKYIDMIPNKPGATAPALRRIEADPTDEPQQKSESLEARKAETKRSAEKHSELSPLASVMLDCYRSALLAMGAGGVRACPAVGSDLQQALASLQSAFSGKITVPLMTQTEAQVELQLQQWSAKSEVYLKSKACEVKDLLIMLARTAESMGERDQRYSKHFHEITAKLQSIANLEDLPQIRSSLAKQSAELKTCVDQMAQDSKKSVAQLQAEVATYETRLKVAEELAQRDSLTGLANRRNLEERIEGRIAQQQPFCLVMVDLDGFKKVNDTHGHLAGDDLLKQFAQELRTNIRGGDIVGRWGGDEFVILLDSDLATAQAQVERIQKWALGEYTIQAGQNRAKVGVDASVGIVQWQAPQTMAELISLADSAMYRQKAAQKKK